MNGKQKARKQKEAYKGVVKEEEMCEENKFARKKNKTTKKKERNQFTKEQKAILYDHYNEHSYLTKSSKLQLSEKTLLSMGQIENFFINARRRYPNGRRDKENGDDLNRQDPNEKYQACFRSGQNIDVLRRSIAHDHDYDVRQENSEHEALVENAIDEEVTNKCDESKEELENTEVFQISTEIIDSCDDENESSNAQVLPISSGIDYQINDASESNVDLKITGTINSSDEQLEDSSENIPDRSISYDIINEDLRSESSIEDKEMPRDDQDFCSGVMCSTCIRGWAVGVRFPHPTSAIASQLSNMLLEVNQLG